MVVDIPLLRAGLRQSECYALTACGVPPDRELIPEIPKGPTYFATYLDSFAIGFASFAIGFVSFATEFASFAIEFASFAIEFASFATWFASLVIMHVLFAKDLVFLPIDLEFFAKEFK